MDKYARYVFRVLIRKVDQTEATILLWRPSLANYLTLTLMPFRSLSAHLTLLFLAVSSLT
jgi:hypothetical protein